MDNPTPKSELNDPSSLKHHGPKPPTLKAVSDAVNLAVEVGQGRRAKIALIAAGWIEMSSGWSRCKPEMPGDREFVIRKCQAACVVAKIIGKAVGDQS